ncbi:MAG: twin-arginine translocation signal domain-containing protein [Gemmataceae bacterium]|nr:twin-arginine translocation signal domain-containing protein [Gemmataceae bacterium]
MLNIQTGLSRRDFLRVGSLGGASVGVPYSPQNKLATFYRTLGIDLATTLPDYNNRPTFLLDDARPIAELM